MPTTYALIIISAFSCLYFLGKAVNNHVETQNLNHVKDILIDNKVEPVNKEVDNKIGKPYNDENVKISKNFYDKNSEEKVQQNSLIFYENIYMQNTGVLYESDKTFNILSVLDGKVKNIKKDKILGQVIEIEHTPNLTTFYYSVKDVKVEIGKMVKKGDIIATSGTNNIKNTKDNCLHFQVFNKGELLNPETFYNMNLVDLI